MPALVAFASLPFGLRGGTYPIRTPSGLMDVYVSELRFSPFLTITSRPELAQSIPKGGVGGDFATYTWYDHPFVLRVVFGRNVASLGSINSSASIVRQLPDDVAVSDEAALDAQREEFTELALLALNTLIAVVRRLARLYQVSDLRRDDIHVTVRRQDGTILIEDPLQAGLIEEEEAQSEQFDLLQREETWYRDLGSKLHEAEPVGLAQDLLIEAERALAQRFPRQAIATCHTAVEAATSALLTGGMHRRRRSDPEIDHLLSTKSLTAKLGVLLGRYTGYSLKRDNYALWNDFNRLNDLRNDVVHRGDRATEEDAKFAIEVTRELLRWLSMVCQRNA